DEVAVSDKLPARVRSSPTLSASGPVEASSSIDCGPIAETTGGRFGAATVTVKLVLVEPPLPSVTVNVMIAEPDRCPAGVTMSARLVPLPPRTMLLSGTSDVSDDDAVTVNRSAGVSTSLTANGSTPVDMSSAMDWLRIPVMVGGSFTGLTVKVKDADAKANAPSKTSIVILAEPDWFASGASVTVRLDPLPPNTMLFVGISAGFEEKCRSARLAAGVVASATVNEIGPVTVSSLFVWLAIGVMVGGVLALSRYTTVKERLTVLFELPLSVTFTVMTELPVK